MKHAIIFDDKDKSATISHDQLARTIELGDAMGDLPKQCPVQPGTLIQNILDNVTKYTSLNATVAPITIREPYCQLNRKKINEGQALDFEDYLVRRMVARIDLPLHSFDGTADKMNAAICLTFIYTDGAKGIQIGFGENINVCDNQTIFGGFVFSTYGGNSKVPFEEGMQLLNHWLQNINILHDKHTALISNLRDAKVHRSGFQRVLGSLFEKAVRRNNGEQINAPLNQSQLSMMVQKGMNVLKDEENREHLSAWEIMNWGTATLKPNNSDMMNLLPDTADFNSFLCNEFKIPMDLAI